MRIRLIRHATLIVEFLGRTLLVDPMLGEAQSQAPIDNAPNPKRFPLTSMPVAASAMVEMAEAVLVTHTHRDHWDPAAVEVIPKSMPLLGQPADEKRFREQGFTSVTPIESSIRWEGIEITRTGGQHGTGEIGRKMAPVSGFVLRAQGEATLYIAGDTIWCPEVESILKQFDPNTVVVNAGAATFLEGDPITMTADDVIRVCHASPGARVIADHMEVVNHCLLTRSDLAFQLEAARAREQVAIPEDGEWVDGRD